VVHACEAVKKHASMMTKQAIKIRNDPVQKNNAATCVRCARRRGNWAAESKWDGARVLAYVSGGPAFLRGRRVRAITDSFPRLLPPWPEQQPGRRGSHTLSRTTT